MANLRWNEELGDYEPIADNFKVGLGNRIDRLYKLLKEYPVSNALFEASSDESIDTVKPNQTFKFSSNSIRQLSIAVNFIRCDYFLNYSRLPNCITRKNTASNSIESLPRKRGVIRKRRACVYMRKTPAPNCRSTSIKHSAGNCIITSLSMARGGRRLVI